MPIKKKNNYDNYKPNSKEIKENIGELQGNINSMLEHLNRPIEDMLPDSSFLPNVNVDVEKHDYEKDIQLIKIDAKETLECLANLYLDEATMKNKNIYNIIKDDSEKLSQLNFSISCARRALISCMSNLDSGINDPLLYQSVAMFQKEMRETIKSCYDLQNRMKVFYKELKDEVPIINIGPEQKEIDPMNNLTIIGDPRKLNEIMEQFKKDPTLLNNTGFTFNVQL